MTDEALLFHVDARGIAAATFNRPEVRNAYDGQMLEALMTVLNRCETDSNVRILVLRGNGPLFQAGADLGWLASLGGNSEEENIQVSRQTARVFRALAECSKPTVALVHGGCFGGGVGFVAGCDVAVAASDTRFAITEARWGLLPSIIVPQLNAAMGVRNVRRYALSCEQFDAEAARRIGLVHEVCDPAALEETAAPIIEGLLASAPDSVGQLKRLALELAGVTLDDEKFERLVRMHAHKRGSAEACEGLASFREKRPPAWFAPPP
jgi:methylglutaconyl-CoA hydratase